MGQNYLREGFWDGTVGDLARMVAGTTWDIVAFAYPYPVISAALIVLGIVYFVRKRACLLAALLLAVPLLVACVFGLAGRYPYQGERQSI